MQTQKTKYELVFDPGRNQIMLPAVRYNFFTLVPGGK